MYKEDLRKESLRVLRKGEYKRAERLLMAQRKRILTAISFLFNSNIVSKVSKLIFQKKFYQLLGFKGIISMLTFFSYPKPWALYVKKRGSMPFFWASYYTANILKRNSQKALDLGCGTGQFLKVLATKTNPSNVFGVDKNFLSLFFARKHFASPKTLLICADVEKGLPFIPDSLDLIQSSDSFHYLKNKNFALKEGVRVLRQSGVYAALHTVNSRKVVFGNVRGITPKKVFALIKKAGFNKSCFYSDTALWINLKNNLPLKLNKSVALKSLRSTFAFGFFAGKKSLPESVNLKKGDYREFKDSQIDYFLDKTLLNSTALEELVKKNQTFVFLSPHLDDAALSCGHLIQYLTESKRKVLVISIFTKAQTPPHSEHAEKFVTDSGQKDARRLFLLRKNEDISSCRVLGADYLHLNYVDATFRKTILFQKFAYLNKFNRIIPSFVHVYPDPKMQFSGEISRQDKGLMQELKAELKDILDNLPGKCIIIAPLGVGGHADHIIVHEVARQIEGNSGGAILFWEDFPYNLNKTTVEDFFSGSQPFEKYLTIDDKLLRKTRKDLAIRRHKSQMKVLFPSGRIKRVDERYYFSTDSIKDRNFSAAASVE